MRLKHVDKLADSELPHTTFSFTFKNFYVPGERVYTTVARMVTRPTNSRPKNAHSRSKVRCKTPRLDHVLVANVRYTIMTGRRLHRSLPEVRVSDPRARKSQSTIGASSCIHAGQQRTSDCNPRLSGRNVANFSHGKHKSVGG